MLAEKLNTSITQLASRLPGGLILTRGAEGVEIMRPGEAAVSVKGIDVQKLFGLPAADPTGCGDAFRGGLLYGLARDASLLDSARLGNLMGALKVIHRGGQNHAVRPPEVARFLQTLYPDTAARLAGHLHA
jgi:adenosine kinase